MASSLWKVAGVIALLLLSNAEASAQSPADAEAATRSLSDYREARLQLSINHLFSAEMTELRRGSELIPWDQYDTVFLDSELASEEFDCYLWWKGTSVFSSIAFIGLFVAALIVSPPWEGAPGSTGMRLYGSALAFGLFTGLSVRVSNSYLLDAVNVYNDEL